MDKIASTVCFEGSVYIFTEHGGVYVMHRNQVTGTVSFLRIAMIELR